MVFIFNIKTAHKMAVSFVIITNRINYQMC